MGRLLRGYCTGHIPGITLSTITRLYMCWISFVQKHAGNDEMWLLRQFSWKAITFGKRTSLYFKKFAGSQPACVCIYYCLL